LIANNDGKKQPRGSYDLGSDGRVIFVRWNDICPVTIASHYFTVKPISKTERGVKNEHRIAAEQSHVVKMYNQEMRGMDMCDRMLSSYRPRLRSRKW